MLRAEIQWDYICLTVLAIATAALAGVFFVLEIGDQENKISGWTRELSALMTGSATALYSAIALRTSRVLFLPRQYGTRRSPERKREETKQALAAFGAMTFPMLTLLILTLVIPVFTTP